MLYLDDLKYMKLYKKKFYLPINKKNMMKQSAILLLTPNYQSSLELMNYPLIINKNNRSFHSYYIEKDIMYTIQNESRNLEIAHFDYTNIINEQPSIFVETTDIKNYENLDECSINELYCKLNDKVIFFNELYDENIFNEAVNGDNSKYKRLLYNDRIRNNKEVFRLYDQVKKDCPWITKTFINYNKYKQENLFIDLYFYNQVYLNNNNFTINKSIDMYFEFIRRFINDRRIDNAGYNKKTVFVPVNGWEYDKTKYNLYDYLKVLNPISVFHKKMKLQINDLHVFDGIDFVFFGKNGYFKMNTSNINERDWTKYIRFIKALEENESIDDSDESDNSADGIATSIIDKIETNNGIKIHSLTGEILTDEDRQELMDDLDERLDDSEELKTELVKKINDVTKNASDEEEALSKMDNDEDLKRILSDLQDQAEDNIKLSATRINRINKAQNDLMNKTVNNKSVRDMITKSNKPKELPEKALPIKTINEEWKHMKSINFEKEYDLDADIIRCLNSLSDVNKNYPISILNIDVEDTSNTEDSKVTYTVKCEDYSGKRFTLKFDIPKLRENRFMRLRGNEKIFSAELPLLPISKTDEDTVQIVSLYNKIFISRYYTSSGKSNPFTDRLIKALNKYTGKDIEIITGDNTMISRQYDLPIDYIDLGSNFSKIKFYSESRKADVTIFFNQDEIREKYEVKNIKGIPVAATSKGEVIYYNGQTPLLSEFILSLIESSSFHDTFESTNSGKKYTYSRASILNTDIPVIIILAHDIGLTKSLELAKIKYDISDKRNKSDNYDSIKFEDGFINYELSYDAMMLMNGLKDCDTESISISSINNKATWVEQLENFGGRIKSDGLDNFKDLMYDPITVDVSRDYKLPDNYHEALIYANMLLADNKYVIHTDLSTNRLRTNEVIAAQFYRVLSSSYKEYALQNKHGRKVSMSMNQSAVIDLILAQNTTSDLSVFQPLLEIETKNTVSTKGASGMNAERAYNIDKRGYDKSMTNIIAQATGFASTVGINRQLTLNPNIVGGRGYFKQSGEANMSVTNTLSMTEALSSFVITSDDPFRNYMTFVQTAKHSTPIEYGTPLLVTTGADAAMPYLTSDMFCHKAKKSGTIKEITNDYMLVEYKDGTSEYVNLSEQTMKNSDGGFYITLQLKTDLHVGSSVKEDTILAYDKKSFSNRIGDHSQVAYNLGCLTKCAIMTTEDGFEDSGVCSEWLSEAMSSDIVVMKDINLDPMVNVLFLAKKGQQIIEGEPILIFQNAYDEQDANILLKNLNNEDGDVSEIGRQVIKSKVTGVISDIKIYRTVEKDVLSDSLKKIVNAKEREIKALKKISDGCINEVQLDSIEKLPMVGKLKNVEGVRIEIYMKYHDMMSTGDKLVSGNANKNILMNIFSVEDSPYTDFRPNEKIDLIDSCSAIDGRMITSPIKIGALNKAMIELYRHVADIMGVKWKDLHEIYYEEMKK